MLFSTSHQAETDGQTKVKNRTLGIVFRTLDSKSAKVWDQKLCHFAYNKSPSYTTKYSPFECVYGVTPSMTITLVETSKKW